MFRARRQVRRPFSAVGDVNDGNTAKPSPVIRWLPSLTDVAFLMPLALLFLRMDGAQRMLGDGDTGWHIRTGEWILQNGRVPDTDLFSFTKAGAALVRLGMALGRCLRLAPHSLRDGGRGSGQHSCSLSYIRNPLPVGKKQLPQRDRRLWDYFHGHGGLDHALAGAAAPFHAALRSNLLWPCWNGRGRARRAGCCCCRR